MTCDNNIINDKTLLQISACIRNMRNPPIPNIVIGELNSIRQSARVLESLECFFFV